MMSFSNLLLNYEDAPIPEYTECAMVQSSHYATRAGVNWLRLYLLYALFTSSSAKPRCLGAVNIR